MVIENIYLFDWNFYAVYREWKILLVYIYTYQICNLKVEHWSNIMVHEILFAVQSVSCLEQNSESLCEM